MIPNIIKKDIFWEGNIYLESWNEFYEKELNLVINIGGDYIIDEVTYIHKQGYNYLISKQQDILNIIFKELYQYYLIWQKEYDMEINEAIMPDISSITELKSLLYPEKIFIMNVDIQEMPYIGVQFKCSWDDEHGIGVMIFKDRIVKVGGSDIAFMNWIAEEDKEMY
jgi:hypothetical protein